MKRTYKGSPPRPKPATFERRILDSLPTHPESFRRPTTLRCSEPGRYLRFGTVQR